MIGVAGAHRNRVYVFEGVVPVVDPTAFVHPAAAVIGDVIIGAGCLVGPGASLRGDLGRIVLEEGANVQDNCTVHTFPGRDCVVERDGHVGHGAVLHGCRVGRNALVGMNAVIMDDAVIGAEAFVAAMSFVKAGTEVPPRALVAGIPAKVLRELSETEVDWKTRGTAVYHRLARRHAATLEVVDPLTEVPPDRDRVPFIEYRPKS